MDATTTPSSATPRPKSLINEKLVAALDRAEGFVGVARRPAVAAALNDQAFAPASTDRLESLATECRGYLARFLASTSERGSQTAKESKAKAALVVLLQEVQGAAKRKWGRSKTEKGRLKGYYVGTTLKLASFATLSEAADAILRQARADALPAITAAKLDALADAISAWKASDALQSEAQNEASAAHDAAEALWKEITTLRLDLQLAADGAFPHADPANLPLRVEFDLPENGPVKTV